MSVTRNRLDEEESPYLRQHADNPVNWQPWDDEALEVAREEDKPIFLSIGYSACHWCHVMADESFADPEVAAVLNEHFVPVKVDREERPDLDSVYITVCQMVRGQAGWPLSVFLTPDGRPFFVGTYFPKEPKRGMPGFEGLCRDIAESWNDPDDREELEDRADQWAAAARGELQEVPDAGEPADADFLPTAADALFRRADRQHGGFGRGQKFPNPGRLHVLLRAYERISGRSETSRSRRAGSEATRESSRDDHRDVATETLTVMANGGLYDHLGGGFHRYCTDREWVVPHFEKMLYDQAGLVSAFLAGYQVTGDERYAEVSHETLAFVERELTHPEGGFFATLDAQSDVPEGRESAEREGAFYVWTPEEVEAAVDDELTADLLCSRYRITESGNFEGMTVLTRQQRVGDLAETFDLPESEVEERLARGEEQLVEARGERQRPDRDEKVLAGWNGLMISGFAEAGLVLDEAYAAAAADALSFVRERLWDGERLQRRWKDGDVKVEGYLEDYAFLGRGAFDLYQATGDVEHLAFGLELARAIEREFYDEDAGTLYVTPASGESLVARPQEPADQSTPSSMGVAASLLAALDHFDPGLAEVAERVAETQAERYESDPAQHGTLVLAADTLAVGHLELTVAADGLPDAWRERLGDDYLPTRLLSVRPPTEDGLAEWLDALDADDAPPIWAGREARDGKPTVYACRSRTCSPPQNDLDAALQWAEDLAPDTQVSEDT
jgi:uncharacterized protein YyaL (SSP411 family)